MKKILLCVTLVVLMLALATTSLAAQVVGPDGAVRTVPDVAQAEEPAQLSAVGGSATLNGVIYVASSDTARVVGYTADIPQDCVIPASVSIDGEDYPVTALADNALYNCAKLTSITLPETLTSLGARSLSGCTGLTEITIPAAVTTIAEDALQSCTGLTAITVAADNAGGYYGDGRSLLNRNGWLLQYALNSGETYAIPEGTKIIIYGAFQGSPTLRSVTFPNSVTEIQGGAFYHCKALTTVELGNGVVRMGDAFSESGLTAIHLPASVRELNDAFRDCENLAEITVDEGNERFYAQDGVLFDRKYTDYGSQESGLALIAYPAASPRTAYTVPSEVRGIGLQAFWSCMNLTDLTLPEGLEYISDSAITNSGLTHLEIPDSVTRLGSWAVQTCKNMTTARLGTGITNIPEGMFQGCTSLRSVNIPAGVSEIGAQAFNRCKSLETIAVDEDNAAFQSVDGVVYDKTGTTLVLCPAAIEQFTIPAAVTEITGSAFVSCVKLTDFRVAEGNGTFYVEDGVLFKKDTANKKTLVAYPAAKTDTAYTVPAGVTALAPHSFEGIQYLTELNTNDVTDVGIWAIYNEPVTKLVLPKVERVEAYGLYATHATTVTLPATLRSIGDQTFDYSKQLEWVTFTAQTPPESIADGQSLYAVLYHCPALRYVYVPVGTQIAYKDALAGNVAPGAMIVEGTYVPQATVEEEIAALDEGSTLAEVNAAAAGVVRMLTAEKKTLATDLLVKADRLFQAAHAGLDVKVDQTKVSDTALTVQGLALASGLVERQDDTGAVSGSVKLTATQETPQAEDELLVLDFSLSVDNAAVQPQSPVVVTLDLPQALRQGIFHLIHRDGETESQVPFERVGDKVTFRADSFSSYVLRAGEPKTRVSYTATTAATLFVAGYRDGQMLSVQGFPVTAGTGAVTLEDYDSALTYKGFVLDHNQVPVGTVKIIVP